MAGQNAVTASGSYRVGKYTVMGAVLVPNLSTVSYRGEKRTMKKAQGGAHVSVCCVTVIASGAVVQVGCNG